MKMWHRYLLSLLLILGWTTAPVYGETPPPEALAKEAPAKEVHEKKIHMPAEFEALDEPQTKGDDRFMTEFLNMLTTLGLVIAVILTLTWFLKRMLNTRIQQINEQSDIKILERRALTPKSTVYLLEIKGKGFIIAESHNGITSLGTIRVDSGEVAGF